MFEFVWGLAVGLFQVLLYGGVVIAWLKAYEWYDDKFIDMKKGSYLGKKKSFIYRINVPAETYVPISQMESFFIDCSELNSFSSTSRIYVDGKWYFNIVFDLICRNGKIETFMRIEESRSVAVLAHLKNHYPNLVVEKVEDPYKDWPKEWWDKDGALGFKQYRGNDIQPKKTDLFPLRSWKDFYRGETLLHDPMSVLISYMKTLPPDCIMVMQYILRPFDFKAPRARWEKELAKLRQEFMNNAYVERKGNTIQALTEHEENILNSVQAKIAKKQYRVKLRWLVLYNKSNKKVDDGEVSRGVKAYLAEYKTEMQALGCYDPSDTDFTYKGQKFGPLDAPISKFLNGLYYKASEKEYRMRRLYAAIIGREIDFGADSNNFFMDTESLAALFHFPEVKFKTSLNTIYNNYRQQQPMPTNDSNNVVIQQYQPAYYIAQDGTVAQLQPGYIPQQQPIPQQTTVNGQQPVYPNQYPPQQIPTAQQQSQEFARAFPQQPNQSQVTPQYIPQAQPQFVQSSAIPPQQADSQSGTGNPPKFQPPTDLPT